MTSLKRYSFSLVKVSFFNFLIVMYMIRKATMSPIYILEPVIVKTKKLGKLEPKLLESLDFISQFSSPAIGLAVYKAGITSIEEAKDLGLIA